ncbi:MAG: type II CAAX prenyl endopeptidase Rce1 family protein [Anaerolineae bacterium]
MEILILTPFILGAWLANYSEQQTGARYLMLVMLGLINLLLLVIGLLMVIAGQLLSQSAVPIPAEVPPIDFRSVGLAVLVTGFAAFIPLMPLARRLLARVISIDPNSLVHTTALVYAVYLVGNTLASWPIINALAESEALAQQVLGQLRLTDAWLMGLFFAATAVVGVGLYARRDWHETWERLKVRGVTGRQLAWTGGALVLLLAVEVGISLAWQFLDPAGYERVGGLTDAFISSFLSPLGALTVGLAAGIGEELLFRGALQPRFGLLLTTLLFTFAHAQYGLSPALIGIFVVGYGLGLTRNRINTTAAILVHAGFNFLQIIAATYLGT